MCLKMFALESVKDADKTILWLNHCVRGLTVSQCKTPVASALVSRGSTNSLGEWGSIHMWTTWLASAPQRAG